ncbi:MAG: hypothetical protein ABI791_00620 [Acidobacteriota bacterium]
MKKFLVMTLLVGTGMFALPSVEANAAANTVSEPQIRVVVGNQRNRRTNRRWNNRQRRVVTQTRITRVGRYRFRETIRTTYLPNGRTRTQVINRVRLAGRYRNM